MGLIRGTTPPIEFTINIEPTLLSALYITFAQNGETVVEKTLADCTVDGNKLTLSLTQADTLTFDAGSVVEIQMRGKTNAGAAIASNIAQTTVGAILKDGEI